MVSLGYGITQGIQHPIKPIENFVNAEEKMPDWFRSGMKAALFAPTAFNQQKFRFALISGNKVCAKTSFTMLNSHLKIDLSIAKYHFEVRAGRDNFEWI